MSGLLKSKTISVTKTRDKPSERRTSVRFPISAVSELEDAVTLTRISARVSDISMSGCYFDALNVFTRGTKVHVNISHANLQFKALGTVVYSLPGMGMGVTFGDIEPDMASVLQRWISMATGEISPVAETPEANVVTQASPRVEHHILGRLIGLMMTKNMLTRDEGVELLEELLRDNKD
jgi:hypothetical protein